MKQNVSSIVIDMGISHDGHYQQVETATIAGTYGVPVVDSHKVAKYWATQFHKASLLVTGSEAGLSIMKRLQEKQVELVKCEVFRITTFNTINSLKRGTGLMGSLLDLMRQNWGC